MGVNRSSGLRRAYYPSGPWLDGYKPSYSSSATVASNPNPNPNNFRIIKAHEHKGYTILQINYPDCTNYEGNKILVFQATLLELVNQKIIDPHFFQDKKYKSPIARFVPTDKGWDMAIQFVNMIAQ